MIASGCRQKKIPTKRRKVFTSPLFSAIIPRKAMKERKVSGTDMPSHLHGHTEILRLVQAGVGGYNIHSGAGGLNIRSKRFI